jgi:hypothetical protein
MSTSPKKKVQVSPRLSPGMKSFVTVKVAGMNLRGTGQYDGYFWNKREIFTTDFMVAVNFSQFSWTVQKDFDTCKSFLLEVFPSKHELYEESFPKILDIDDDVFVLVNRKEAMEKFLGEVVSTMDFIIFHPLYRFLSPGAEMAPVLREITRLQAFTRRFLVQSSMEDVRACMQRVCVPTVMTVRVVCNYDKRLLSYIINFLSFSFC